MSSPISFQTHRLSSAVMISFSSERTLLPYDLKTLLPPDPVKTGFAHLGVVLSGRGPVWLYGFLTHFYHPCRFVAVHDPRLKAAVIVEAHVPDMSPGDLIPIEPIVFSPNN